MSRLEIRQERCKGCLLCTLVCPEDILEQSEELNAQGYRVIQMAQDKKDNCQGCAFCAEICPDCVIRVFRTRKRKEVQPDAA